MVLGKYCIFIFVSSILKLFILGLHTSYYLSERIFIRKTAVRYQLEWEYQPLHLENSEYLLLVI